MRAVFVKRKKLFSICEHFLKFCTGLARREAFVTFSELFALFSKHLHSTNTSLANLVFDPPPYLQDILDVCLTR